MTAAVKEKVEKIESPLEQAINARKKEAIEKIAPKLIELITVAGVRGPFGYVYTEQGVRFEYQELTGVVMVTLGSNEMFAANVDNKKCSLYRNGSWVRVFDELYNSRVAGKDINSLKGKHEVKFREYFGINA